MQDSGENNQALAPQNSPEDLAHFAERVNEDLRLGGAGSAEQAFGLGCTIGFIPLLILMGVLFVLKVINLILALFLLAMGLLALVGISMMAAQQARQSGIRRAYRSGIEAEIIKYMDGNNLSRAQFDSLVSELLPRDAPLQVFLTQREQR